GGARLGDEPARLLRRVTLYLCRRRRGGGRVQRPAVIAESAVAVPVTAAGHLRSHRGGLLFGGGHGGARLALGEGLQLRGVGGACGRQQLRITGREGRVEGTTHRKVVAEGNAGQIDSRERLVQPVLRVIAEEGGGPR